MQKNWTAVVLMVLSAEIAALIVLVAVWLPKRMPQGGGTETSNLSAIEGRLAEIENSMGQLKFRQDEAAKRGGNKDAVGRELKIIIDRLDDIGTQIYELDQDSTRNLMRMQTNIMRRLSVLGGGSGPPEDHDKLVAWLDDGGVQLDSEKQEIRFECSIASPHRPLETVVATEGGPLHEALFEAHCRPWAVRAGLEALGLEVGKPADFMRGIEASGDKVAISVSWPGLEAPIPLDSMILDLHTDAAMTSAEWVFTGSNFDTSFATGEQIYIPDESRVVISLTHNFGHLAVVSCRHPDAGNEMNWQVKLDRLPEQPDTKITIHMSRVK